MTVETRPETAHQLACRAADLTPAQLNTQTRHIGRFLWYVVVFLAGVTIGMGFWWGLPVVAVLTVINLVAAGRDEVTGERTTR